MVDEAFPEQSKQAYQDRQKQLRRQEQRLVERLREAETEQASALERFRHAEARLLKRIARTQRIEARLATVRQQIEAFEDVDAILLHAGIRRNVTRDESQMSYIIDNSTPLAKAQAARAVAEATEEAARLAIARAHHVAAHLAHMATGRHLIQELLTLEEDAARASVAALDAELAAQEAEQLANAEPFVLLPLNESTTDAISEKAERTEGQILLIEDISDSTQHNEDALQAVVSGEDVSHQIAQRADDPSDQAVPSVEDVFTDETEINTHMGPPAMLERERVAEVDEEEGMVEMVAAMMIADVTAANAANAEALAEEASARTREARRLVYEIDAVLERIRDAIRSGTSSGDAAEAILFDAERDATRAHAMLADAEAAEERARRAAMEAEAEAEVAEGMAFATEERTESAETQCEEDATALLTGQHTGDTGEIEQLPSAPEKQLEDEDTIELPVVHTQHS